MLSITKTTIASLATDLRFNKNTLEKVCRLIRILDYINTNPLTRKKLLLKGGTAINLTMLPLHRLSVDIDLDYHSQESRDEVQQSREKITADLLKYLEIEKYKISDKSRFHYSLDSFVVEYINFAGNKDAIKIEINYSLRAHIYAPAINDCASLPLAINTAIATVHPLEIFASKINALLNRAAARDLYDINSIIEAKLFTEKNFKALRKAIVFYTAISSDAVPNQYDLHAIETITTRKIYSDILPVVRNGEFVNLNTLQTNVLTFLRRLLRLEITEEKFLLAFSNREFKPELLYSHGEELKNIRYHPMALWKIQAHKSTKTPLVVNPSL